MKDKYCEYCQHSYLSGDEVKCVLCNDPNECEEYDLHDYFKKELEKDLS